MAITPLPDWPAVGSRVALARRTLELTQEALAEATGIERTALSRIESGTRNLSALELAALARATGLPADWFVAEPPSVVASRRASELQDLGIVDIRVEVLARDVAQLLELDLLRPAPRTLDLKIPRDIAGAERAALDVRAHLGCELGELIDLAAAAEALGAYAYSLVLPDGDAAGAYVALSGRLGVVLVNGVQPSSRRRFTLAHELGHHVFQDAYAVDLAATGRSEMERLLDAFAIHLLLPHQALLERWRMLDGPNEPRRAAIILGAEYRLSWTALCGHLANLGVLERQEGEVLREAGPRRGEYAELGVEIVEEFVPAFVPRSIVQAVLRGYRTHRLGTGRTIELLHGTLGDDDLPDRDALPREALAGELRRA